MKKRSIFERLSGSIPAGDDYDFEDDYTQPAPRRIQSVQQPAPHVLPAHHEEEPADGQLPVDVYQTPNEIVVRTFIAGVRPEDIGVSISRDMIVLEGSRDASSEAADHDFFHQELFWGRFSRTILLPQEIDVDASTAGAKDGLLTLVLPKLDKARQTKLRVKAG